MAMTFSDREEIENAVEQALRTRVLGGLIGGGTGHRYAYVEVALVDVKAGIAAIRNALQLGHVPLRSWILFHDAYLSGEWIGIYEDSPEPPGYSEDNGDE